MIAEVCGIAPGAPIGGCDPPHPDSIAAAAQLKITWRLKPGILILFLSQSQPIGGVNGSAPPAKPPRLRKA
jgi:hypothetical protein